MDHLRKILVSFILACIFGFPVQSQTIGEWLGMELNMDLPKGFSFKVSNSERFINTGLGLYKYLFQFEAGYHINKHFDAAVIYRTAWKLEDNDAFYYRNKLSAELSADFSAGRFRFKNRLRWQRRTKTYIEDKWDAVPLKHIRNKVSAKYDIRHCKFTPSIFFESFFPLYSFRRSTVDELRLGSYLEYKFSKKHTVKGGIMMQNGVAGFPVQAVWFRLSYTYTLVD